MIGKLIDILKEKYDGFIGSLENPITVSHSLGFKDGLQWAIDTAQKILEDELYEHEYNLQEQERLKMQEEAAYYREYGEEI